MEVIKKSKAGRKMATLTDEQKQQLPALSATLTTEQIADYFGIGRSTFHKIKKREKEIQRLYKQGRAKAIQTVANNLIEQSEKGTTAATIFYLRTQGGWKEGDSGDSGDSKPLKIVFGVRDAVKDIQITRGG